MIFSIVKNNTKQDIKTIAAIFILMIMSFIFLFLSISMSYNTLYEIEERLDKKHFGDMLVLTNGKLAIDPTINYISENENVESVDCKDIIYSSYEFIDKKSDVDAIIFKISDRGKKNLSNKEIALPISMKGIIGIKENDEIAINIKRNQKLFFKVKYFFEDEVFGSSMIGIKRFYINDNAFDDIKKELSKESIDNLANNGYSFFIKGVEGAEYRALSSICYDNPNISNAIEHIYSKNTIVSYMSLLINIFVAFLFLFSLLLTVVSVVIIYYALKNSITYDRKKISNLKILGYKNREIIYIYLIEWNIPIIIAFVVSVLCVEYVLTLFYDMTYVANGIMFEGRIFFTQSVTVISIIVLIINVFIIFNLKKIYKIKPAEISTIVDFTNKNYIEIKQGSILAISIREVVSRKKQYLMIAIVCILLSLFNNQIYRINIWLDNGKGLMNSFNPTDMDYGVQSIKDVDIDEVISEINKINSVEYVYLLGMTNLNIDGYNLRANVSSDTSKFHILRGNTIKNADEILLTDVVASNLSKNIGDSIQVRGTKGDRYFQVVGIYECANEMGDNVGISKDGFEKISDTPKNFYCYHLFLQNKNTDNLTTILSEKYGAQIYTHTNTWSGLDSIVSAMNMLIRVLIFLTIVISAIITIIQVNDILKNEIKNLTIYKFLGFSRNEISASLAVRFVIVSSIGVIVGIILIKLFSDKFINYLFRHYGICAYTSYFTIQNILLSIFIIFLFGIFSYCYSNKLLKNVGNVF